MDQDETMLRDRFAMAALQGALVSGDIDYWLDEKNRLQIATGAYEWADAMMKARSK